MFNNIHDATDKVFYFASSNILVNIREMTRYLIKMIHFFHPYILVINNAYIYSNNTNGISPFCDKESVGMHLIELLYDWLNQHFSALPTSHRCKPRYQIFTRRHADCVQKNNKLLSYDKCKSIKVDFNATRLFGFRQSKLWHCYTLPRNAAFWVWAGRAEG